MFTQGFRRFYMSLKGVPDRVPFIAQMHEFAMKWTREPAQKFYSDPQLLVQRTIDTAVDFDFDIPWLGYDVYNIEIEALGISIKYSDNSPPEIGETRPLINDRRDFDRLVLPDPYSSKRMPFVLEANRLYEKTTGYPPPIQFTSPFSMAVLVRGFENLIDDIYTNSDFAHELLCFITENLLAPWIITMKKECPNATLFRGADAMASLPMVNIKILEEFAVPYILRLKELCGDAVTAINWWGEKFLKTPEEMLRLKLKISPDLIQGQDPDVEAIGPEIFKNFAVKNRAALVLGVGNSFLQQSGEEAIRNRIAQYLKSGSSGGRFILYLCYLSAITPVDNVKAAVKAIKEYGTYSSNS